MLFGPKHLASTRGHDRLVGLTESRATGDLDDSINQLGWLIDSGDSRTLCDSAILRLCNGWHMWQALGASGKNLGDRDQLAAGRSARPCRNGKCRTQRNKLPYIIFKHFKNYIFVQRFCYIFKSFSQVDIFTIQFFKKPIIEPIYLYILLKKINKNIK